MASNTLRTPFHCPHRRLKSTDYPYPTTLSPSSSSALFLKPPSPTISVSNPPSFTPLSLSPSTTTAPSTISSFDLLRQHLSSGNFREADEETRRLLIVLAGEAALARGYVFFSEVQFISASDLQTVDELWRKHSNGRFGYSVQKKIWEKAYKDFTSFFIRVGWMKKLETEIEQYNYRAFPSEFIWELNDETPEGHLPLTNALRGTQLLSSILSHPAFCDDDDDNDGNEEERQQQPPDAVAAEGFKLGLNSKPLSKVFKTDYSF